MIDVVTPEKPEADGAGAAQGSGRIETSVADARAALLHHLKRQHYRFVTPSIATHRRNIRREGREVARDVRDVFGWSLPFKAALLDSDLLALMEAASVLAASGHLLRSTVRVASLGQDHFLHSAFPPNADDAVFFGPDTYRFANFLAENLLDRPAVRTLVDVGTGSGVGGIVAARHVVAERVILRDLNPQALYLARANAQAAEIRAECLLGDGLEGIASGTDLVVANPPFIAGDGGRTYRDGGDLYGARISLQWALAAAERLAPGGRALLYTGSAIVAGRDPFQELLTASLPRNGFRLTYAEIDPDIFGGQLSAPAYADVERIAAVGVRIDRVL